jgi:hypothetical protein
VLKWVTGHCNRAAVSRNRYSVLHRNRRYFVIKLHTWFCLSYFLKTNIKLYCIYQYFMSINSFFNTVSVHLDFWLSVNLFARGGAYDTFSEVAIISRLHLTTCTKACMTKVTPKLEYTEVLL